MCLLIIVHTTVFFFVRAPKYLSAVFIFTVLVDTCDVRFQINVLQLALLLQSTDNQCQFPIAAVLMKSERLLQLTST